MTPSIDTLLVKRLLESQFPRWKDLPIEKISPGGWDNRSFRLGDDLLIRMPSEEHYVCQVEKEQVWLPKLATALPLKIPEPVAIGKPDFGYPWSWSIYQWIEGDPATTARIANINDFAVTLAQFLRSLEAIDTTNAPLAGKHCFYRGGELRTYHDETIESIKKLNGKIDTKSALAIWESAIKTKWQHAPVWVHGDISPGNLIVKNGKLNAVIDFGQLCAGDPACDFSIAWTFFSNESRILFREYLMTDSETWLRGCAWALWKALIVAAEMAGTNPLEIENSKRIIHQIITTYGAE